MSTRAFMICLVLLGVVVLLSAAPFPGALIGFFFGIAVAFFVAGPTQIAAAALSGIGIEISWTLIVYGLVALYGLAVVVAFMRAWRAWAGQDAPQARLLGLKGMVLAALPLIALLSSRALVEAWP